VRIVPDDPVCPWSPEDLDRIVEEACEFIRARRRAHARGFGWEVGDHLFLEVYRGDEGYLRSRYQGKPDSIGDIARATGIPQSTLYVYVMAAVVRHKLKKAGLEPELDLRQLAILDELNDHFEALRALAEWAERKEISCRDLEKAVDFWKGHVEKGGSLMDLRRDPGRPLRKVGRRRARPSSPDVLKASRMLGVVGAWWRKAKLTGDEGRELRDRLLRIRAMLAEAG